MFNVNKFGCEDFLQKLVLVLVKNVFTTESVYIKR